MRWCTVTVTDQDGRRHSVDVQATSTFDAAHLFVVEAKKERAVLLQKPTLATVFEVVAAGQVYRVTGTALQTWIVEKRRSWNGPKGYLFCKRLAWNNGSQVFRRAFESSRELDRTRSNRTTELNNNCTSIRLN